MSERSPQAIRRASTAALGRWAKCCAACGVLVPYGGRVGAAWLVTGPALRSRQTAPRGAVGAGCTGVAPISRRLLEILVYGDWKMRAFKPACTYAASQGWLIVEDDVLTLTTAGLEAA